MTKRTRIGRRGAWAFIAAVFGGAVPPPALADDTISLRYEAYWGGFHTADVDLTVGVDNNQYHSNLGIVTQGLVGTLWRWRSQSFSFGRVDGDTLAPLRYDRTTTKRFGSDRLLVTYDPATGLARGSENGEPDDEVPESLRFRVVDPLAAFVAARDRIGRDAKGTFTIPVYDGARRYDMRVTVGTPGKRNILNVVHDVLPVEMSMVPLRGFKEDTRYMWDGNVMELWLSRDSALVPLQIMVDTRWGIAAINLVAACPTVQGIGCHPPPPAPGKAQTAATAAHGATGH